MLEISLSFICAFPVKSDETVRFQGPAKYSSQTLDSLALWRIGLLCGDMLPENVPVCIFCLLRDI